MTNFTILGFNFKRMINIMTITIPLMVCKSKDAHLRGMRETFLKPYVLVEDVPIHVGLKYMAPSPSSRTSADSADPQRCTV